jgi:hypothetical protein
MPCLIEGHKTTISERGLPILGRKIMIYRKAKKDLKSRHFWVFPLYFLALDQTVFIISHFYVAVPAPSN